MAKPVDIPSYKILDRALLKEEIHKLKTERLVREREWELESAKYEETIKVPGIKREKEIPRRNYANPEGVVQDPDLFPYHTSCYPLLDAYDCLYTENQRQPIPTGSVPPSPIDPDERREVVAGELHNISDVLPNSIYAIGRSLLQKNVEMYSMSEFIDFMKKVLGMWNVMIGTAVADEDLPIFNLTDIVPGTLEDSDDRPYGPPHWPEDRVDLMCKLLRHTTSSLQRDHRLGAAVLFVLARHRDPLQHLRRILLSIDVDLHCWGPCDQDPDTLDHYCYDYDVFAQMFGNLFGKCSMPFLTEDVVLTVTAWVRSAFEESFGYLARSKAETPEARVKNWLKRYAIAGVTDDPTKDRIPVVLLNSLVDTLGKRLDVDVLQINAMQEYVHMLTEDKQLELAKDLQSLYHGVQILVEIGWAVVEFCPDQERIYPLASKIVYALARVFCPIREEARIKDTNDAKSSVSDDDHCYLALLSSGTIASQKVTEPFRYADCITEATQRYRASRVQSRANMVDEEVQRFFRGPPPEDVVKVVRGLFLRELVDKRESGLGYGDFLLWSRSDISALDATLYWHDCAYPSSDEEDSETDLEDDEDADSLDWDVDENGHALTRLELEARYDFSLLALQEAWSRPWSSETHMSFSLAFRKAALTLLLTMRQKNVPPGVANRVLEYMNRDWWPDLRDECAEYNCQLNRLAKMAMRRNEGKEHLIASESQSILTCANCFRRYCSKSCLKREQKEHKPSCGRGCFIPHTPPVLEFIEAVRRNSPPDERGEKAGEDVEEEIVVLDGDNEDDEEDWSSVDSESDEDNQLRSYRTKIIKEMLG